IRENPYALERDIHGVGFKTADALALQLGTPRDAIPRYMTGIKHVLSETASADGHCFLPPPEVFTRAAALLDVAPASMAPALERLALEKEVFLEEEDRVFLAPFFYAENGTARRLRMLLKAPNPLPPVEEAEWRAIFTVLEREHGVRLAVRQQEAVRMAY